MFAQLQRMAKGLLRERRSREGSVAMTRREALGLSAALLAACTNKDDKDEGTDDTSEGTADKATARVAIVGGGIAGLHCAYRLIAGGIGEVMVYEAGDRVGGRMWTGRDDFTGQICERGGELVDTNHATLFALADEFGLVLDDRFKFIEDNELVPEIYEVGGEIADDAVILTQFKAVIGLMADAVEAADTDDTAYETLDNTTLKDWLDTNVPPATYPELHAALSTAYRGEFGLENDEQSALNMLYLIGVDDDTSFKIFGESDERFHFHEGNDAVPAALADAIGAEAIALGHKLTKATKSGSTYLLTFSTSGGDVEVECDHVVMALPYSTLRDVDYSGLAFSADKIEIIENLGYGTNAKVMLGFTTRVWNTVHKASGSITTDRGVQQTWDTTIGQSGDQGILTNFLGGDQGAASADGTAEEWAQKVLPDLEAIYPGLQDAYITDSALRIHWPTMPNFKGSYTCYKPGQWAWWATEGIREGNVHFCGEHVSADFQGWMEGGAETGAVVAAEILADYDTAPPPPHARIVDRHIRQGHPCFNGQGLKELSPRERWVLGRWRRSQR